MEYLAHSARDNSPPQTYVSHIKGVCVRATTYAEKVEQYASKSCGLLKNVAQQSAIWHDLGKLDLKNQAVLHGLAQNAHHLPINHVDAGSAVLLSKNEIYAALAVYSHHRGLPDMTAEGQRGDAIFRDEHPSVRAHVNSTLHNLVSRHSELILEGFSEQVSSYSGNQSVFLRMLLSCLVDADHTDTANAYGQVPINEEMPQLRAKERLLALDNYVSRLGSSDERSILRRKMYDASRDADISSCFTICDSPVGSGKTTAVMAHLLKQADVRKARRIFVVLPYTSIIQQSVDVYRKALALPEEDPESVVAELHSRADFQNADTRYLTALWRAPIIVTTAVAFFETLASSCPAALRRLHELPGSVIFVDECHNALPTKLLPLAWQWMNTLAEEWGCYWVLASGSLVRFWELSALRSIALEHPQVSELVNSTLRKQLMAYERDRIAFHWNPKLQSRKDLITWVNDSPGPRLLIVNTVQSAAVIATDFYHKYGRNQVEHLSTALTPEDRDEVIKRVKKRLADKTDTNWTLVATSCVEAGVDFSFRTGFRELSSLLSLLQASGRVNRHGRWRNAQMWSFSFQDDPMLVPNPSLGVSNEVLKRYFSKAMHISPELSTESVNDELTYDDSCIRWIRELLTDESVMKFRKVDEKFSVIESNTVTAIVDRSLANAIAHGNGDWRQLQRRSVSIRRKKIHQWHLKEIASGVYQWMLPYDCFLGYMRGVLDAE